MTERAQALEHLRGLARDIGTVRDVEARRSPDVDDYQQRKILARLGQWRGGILTVIDILEAVKAPPAGVSPEPKCVHGFLHGAHVCRFCGFDSRPSSPEPDDWRARDAEWAGGDDQPGSILPPVQPPPPVGSPTTEHEHDYVTVELCRHCLRTEADITGECHHCGEGTGARCWWCLKLKSASFWKFRKIPT